MGHALELIRLRVQAGDRDGARIALADLVKAEPENADAWALLAILLKDPGEQAECYRQILRIDPGNRQAAMWLEVLVRPAESLVGEESSVPRAQRAEDTPGELSSPEEMPSDDLMLPATPSSVRPGGRLPRARQLSPEEVLELAGGPLAPEERRQCPACLAMVARTEARCPWCSAPLPALEDG